jgi:hypothetical protein
MTLIITESFDGVASGGTNAQLVAYLGNKHGRYISGMAGLQGGAGGGGLAPVVGRHPAGGTAANLNGTFTSATLNTIFEEGTEHDTVIIGLAIKIPGWAQSIGRFLSIGEARSTGTVEHIRITGTAGPPVLATVQRSPSTTLGTFSLPVDTLWRYLEIKIRIHDTLGTVDVRLDGVSVLSLSGQDTRNAGVGNVSYVNWMQGIDGGASVSTNYSIEDMYICTGAGSAPFNDFLGDVTIEYLQPTANDSVAWTPSTGANWDAVADAQPVPVITDYVSSSTIDQLDQYVLADSAYSSPSDLLGVESYAYADKADSGNRTLAIIQELSGSVVASSDLTLRYTSNGGPMYLRFPRDLAPDAAAWTLTKLNSSKLGIKARP